MITPATTGPWTLSADTKGRWPNSFDSLCDSVTWPVSKRKDRPTCPCCLDHRWAKALRSGTINFGRVKAIRPRRRRRWTIADNRQGAALLQSTRNGRSSMDTMQYSSLPYNKNWDFGLPILTEQSWNGFRKVSVDLCGIFANIRDSLGTRWSRGRLWNERTSEGAFSAVLHFFVLPCQAILLRAAALAAHPHAKSCQSMNSDSWTLQICCTRTQREGGAGNFGAGWDATEEGRRGGARREGFCRLLRGTNPTPHGEVGWKRKQGGVGTAKGKVHCRYTRATRLHLVGKHTRVHGAAMNATVGALPQQSQPAQVLTCAQATAVGGSRCGKPDARSCRYPTFRYPTFPHATDPTCR
eukprot:gene12666-biopygen7955